MRIEIAIANIVRQPDIEAVVNSANANLRFGSGVAGAIHTAAGPGLEAYCRPLAPLALGQAVVTPGFDLPNRWIIHLRAPHFLNDDAPEAAHRQALSSMLEVVRSLGITSLAIPAIGTGVFRTPPEQASRWLADAMSTVGPESKLQIVRICVVSDALSQVYARSFSDAGLAAS